MDPITAKNILSQLRKDYDTIADDFSQTRKASWPEFACFKKYLKPGQKILDAGCGNGRLYGFLLPHKINYVGADNSQGLLRQARKNFPNGNFIYSDLLHLLFADREFDAVFCIAALHHIPSGELRSRALKEIKRVLKPGGYLLMTNWNLFQKKYFLRICKYSVMKIMGKNKMDFRDVLIPWAQQAKRYYHAFTLKELAGLASQTGFKIIKQEKESRNIVSVFKK